MNGPLGAARKSRTIYEGDEWDPQLGKLGLTQEEWDEHFHFAVEANISEQPLVNTWPFLEDCYRLMQMQIANWIIWIYFRIESDDDRCTLLWLEARPIRKIS
ncbi:MAG TPA: hypothetical protein VFA24_05510 [Gaiellaceae bacterium]|nr:hypothetical protein [Gaiellaceae bacterium]